MTERVETPPLTQKRCPIRKLRCIGLMLVCSLLLLVLGLVLRRLDTFVSSPSSSLHSDDDETSTDYLPDDNETSTDYLPDDDETNTDYLPDDDETTTDYVPNPPLPTVDTNVSPAPSESQTQFPTTKNPPPPDDVTYRPGLLNVSMHGLLLSEGLTARIVATSGTPVQYSDNSTSDIVFHELPDAGETFIDLRPNNIGGWVYVSNSEVREHGGGGVGAITFNRNGDVIDYRMVLTDSTHNCGGGRTPWNTWISCEESYVNDTGGGEIYQVDPYGIRSSAVTSVGAGFGKFESFTYDIRDINQPKFFASEDRPKGAVRRFVPTDPNWSDPWTMLHGNGTLDYLILIPAFENATHGTIEWTSDREVAKQNAKKNYPNCEGIDVDENLLYLVSKVWKSLWIFNLDDETYERFSTAYGLFDGQPDQVERVLADKDDDTILYFTEEGGAYAGVHGRNKDGQFFTILEGPEHPDETTGLAFSPDGKHMMIAYQDNGILFDITRTDGFPFHGRTLNVKYHVSDL